MFVGEVFKRMVDLLSLLTSLILFSCTETIIRVDQERMRYHEVILTKVSPHSIPTQNQGQFLRGRHCMLERLVKPLLAKEGSFRYSSIPRRMEGPTICEKRQNLLLSYSKTLSVDSLGN